MSRNMDDAPEGEIILFCIVGTDQTACLARRHWFEEADANSNTKRLGFQSTWDGSEIPREWKPFAWALVEHPDPAG